MTMKMEVFMTINKVTKGAIQYAEVDSLQGNEVSQADAILKSLYIRKSGLITNKIAGQPTNIKVTIEVLG